MIGGIDSSRTCAPHGSDSSLVLSIAAVCIFGMMAGIRCYRWLEQQVGLVFAQEKWKIRMFLLVGASNSAARFGTPLSGLFLVAMRPQTPYFPPKKTLIALYLQINVSSKCITCKIKQQVYFCLFAELRPTHLAQQDQRHCGAEDCATIKYVHTSIFVVSICADVLDIWRIGKGGKIVIVFIFRGARCSELEILLQNHINFVLTIKAIVSDLLSFFQ